jgi:hypothetical protein
LGTTLGSTQKKSKKYSVNVYATRIFLNDLVRLAKLRPWQKKKSGTEDRRSFLFSVFFLLFYLCSFSTGAKKVCFFADKNSNFYFRLIVALLSNPQDSKSVIDTSGRAPLCRFPSIEPETRFECNRLKKYSVQVHYEK